jgi:hypothetical protein
LTARTYCPSVPPIGTGETDMTTSKAIKTVRGATGETRFFETEAEAMRWIMRRGDLNELWRIER